MDAPIRNSRDTLPLAADQRIDRACLEFEKTWKSGGQPRIEHFLGTTAGAERERLIRELLLLELDYRSQAGEQPAAEEYHRRLPDQSRVIEQVFQSCWGSGDEPAPGTRIRYFGDYELLGEIARGGMGIVYKARQLSLNRIVALKLVLAGQFASDEEAERFHREAEAAANLQHPNIVPIHEVGQHEGQPYFSMAYVEGRSLAEMIREHPLPGLQAARYVETVAQAVDYAHQRGTLHRDLKPANILIDRDDQPRITDFGLARRVDADSDLTKSGQILGSPSYMPPEQASGRPGEVGPRSDVYALGAVLYDLVTGRPPFKAETPTDTLLHVLHSEPVSPRVLNPRVPRDLETICLKCLEKEPQRRYASAAELSEELGRFLEGKPIQARPITSLGRFWRWCKRRPALAALGLTVAGLVLFVAVAAPVVAIREAWLRNTAQAREAEARLAAIREAEAREETRRQLYVADMNVAQQAWEVGNVKRVHELLKRHRPTSNQKDLRGFEWYYLWRLCKLADDTPSLDHGGTVVQLSASPDGNLLASIEGPKMYPVAEGSFKIWDVASRRLVGEGPGRLLFSPDNKTIALARDGSISLFDQAVEEELRTLDGGPPMSFSWDGNMFMARHGETLRIWSLQTDELVEIPIQSGLVWCVVFSPDGSTVAWGSDEDIQLWNMATEKTRRLARHTSIVRSISFSPKDDLLASAGQDGRVILWDLAKREPIQIFDQHGGVVRAVTFSTDGQLLASASQDGTVRLWNVRSREQLRVYRGQFTGITSIVFVPGKGILASGAMDGTVKLWDIEKRPDGLFGRSCNSIAFAPNGQILASGGTPSGSIVLWDIARGEELGTLEGHVGRVTSVAFSPAEMILASGGEDGSVRLWDVDARAESRQLEGHRNAITSVAFSCDGETLAAASEGRSVLLWEVATGKPLRVLKDHDGPVTRVAFSPSQDVLAWASCGAVFILLHPRSGNRPTVLGRNIGRIQDIAFSPNGELLAASGDGGDRNLMVWDLSTGRLLDNLRGRPGSIATITFCSDGETLASAGLDRMVTLWDVITGEERLALRGHRDSIKELAFSPTDQLLASAAWSEKAIRLWRAGTEEEVLRHRRAGR